MRGRFAPVAAMVVSLSPSPATTVVALSPSLATMAVPLAPSLATTVVVLSPSLATMTIPLVPSLATMTVPLLLAACGTRSVVDSASQPGLKVADAALQSGTPQVALQVVSNILASSPNNTAALALNGDALTALGRFEEATTSFEKAVSLDGRSVRANVGLGRLRLATDPAAAERFFLTALQNDPRDAVALNNLGIALDLQNRHAEAQASYGKALGVRPDFPAAQVNMALSMAMTGNADRAERLIRPLAEGTGASRKLRHDYAAVLAMGGKRKEASQLLAADLTPAEVQAALEAFEKARSGASPPLFEGVPGGRPH